MNYRRFVSSSLHRWGVTSLSFLTVGVLLALHMNSADSSRCTEVRGERLVNLPLAELRAGTATAFCYRDPAGEVIHFIVARDLDGTVHSAFDACRSCFEYHEGYRLTGQEMICRFCGTRYRVQDMGKGVASCIPIRLPHLISSDVVQIKVTDLEAGRRLFRKRID
jgi:uncharacterized membrane protein